LVQEVAKGFVEWLIHRQQPVHDMPVQQFHPDVRKMILYALLIRFFVDVFVNTDHTTCFQILQCTVFAKVKFELISANDMKYDNFVSKRGE